MKIVPIVLVALFLLAFVNPARADFRSDFLPDDFRATDSYTFYIKGLANQSKDSYQPSARLEICADGDCEVRGSYTAKRAITPSNGSWTLSLADSPTFKITGGQILDFLARHPKPTDGYVILLSLGRVFEGKFIRASNKIFAKNELSREGYKYRAQFINKTSEDRSDKDLDDETRWTFSETHNFRGEFLTSSFESRKDVRIVPFLTGYAEIKLDR